MSEFRCPRCGEKYVCGCASCKKLNPGLHSWLSPLGELESCAHCGLTATVDQWFEEEFWQISDREPISAAFRHTRPTLDGYLMRPHKAALKQFGVNP